MKPLVTTVRALRELATSSSGAPLSSTSLFRTEQSSAEFLLTAEDGLTTQRVIVMRDGYPAGSLVPPHLNMYQREVLSRVASFAERAKTRPLALPKGWSQYKHNSLVAFYAVAGIDPRVSRWIVELLPGDESSVLFWRVTTSDKKTSLEDFYQSDERRVPDTDDDWVAAIEAAESHFGAGRVDFTPDVDMFLPPSPFEASTDRSFQGWLAVASPEQRAFIEAPTTKSLRLRGPAGSGKTLAITLKAVREVLEARAAGSADPRVLVVTHSWALGA